MSARSRNSTLSKYKFTYFNVREKGELCRMIFAAADQEFEDDRIANFEAWNVIKPTTPLGQVPVLEVYEGSNLVIRMSQSIACARFLARRFDMAGSSEIEQAEVDMYADMSLDLFNAAVKIYFEKDQFKKSELKSKYLDETIPASMKLFEARLNKTNTGYLVGNKLTWADLYLYNIIDNLSSPIYQKKEETLNNFPVIKKHFESISNLSGVAKYLAKRPISEH